MIGKISVIKWNTMTIEERVDACYNHYSTTLQGLHQTQKKVDMEEYITVKTILGILENIRGHDALHHI